MARAFAHKKGRYVARLDAAERALLTELMEQTRALVAPPEQATTGDEFADLVASMGDPLREHGIRPVADLDEDRDPALDRLLPAAHRADDAIAADFRRRTEVDLRRRKAANFDVALAALQRADAAAAQDPGADRVELAPVDAQAFLIALTDTRLLLGERLGMRTEEDVERLEAAAALAGSDTPLAYAVSVYDFLTWLQETLAHAMLKRL